MRFFPALIVDALLVLVFAAIGRASHGENPAGFLVTAWPFLVALLIGHALAALLPSRPRRPWSLAWGAVVWVVTVAAGLGLRVASGDTAQVPFIIVATLVLALFLLGWRAITGYVRRRSARTKTDAETDAETDAVGDDTEAEPVTDSAEPADAAELNTEPDAAG